MNERIRELAEQAEKYADENFKGEPTYSEAYDSKFAELIVKECISICKEKERPNLYGVREVEQRLKKHFGVEE